MFSGPNKLPTAPVSPLAPRLTFSELRDEGEWFMAQSELEHSKIWSQVLPAPEPKATVLAKFSSSSPKTIREELWSVQALQPNPRHSNRPFYLN
jgi:hypothetical protein